jgi:hypothetical protein
MPVYDRLCIDSNCNTELLDCLEPIEAPDVKCPKCGRNTERAWIGKTATVVADEIPGGIWIRHGLCNEDGSPRKYYSKSEIAREAEKRGLVQRVEHTIDPRSGSDRAPHTVRWTAAPTISEEDRVKHWREHERKLSVEVERG